jgi:hypothetical protein
LGEEFRLDVMQTSRRLDPQDLRTFAGSGKDLGYFFGAFVHDNEAFATLIWTQGEPPEIEVLDPGSGAWVGNLVAFAKQYGVAIAADSVDLSYKNVDGPFRADGITRLR